MNIDRLDHGALNVPLSKRGSIDAQIDRYKRDQARDAAAKRKADAAQMKDDRERAKALLAGATDDKIRALYDDTTTPSGRLRKKLASDAHWQPSLVIKLLSRFSTHS